MCDARLDAPQAHPLLSHGQEGTAAARQESFTALETLDRVATDDDGGIAREIGKLT